MKIIKSLIDDTILGIIIEIDEFEKGTKFHGDRKEPIQVATFKYDNGRILRNHRHIERTRIIDKTQEAIVVLRGSCEIRIFDIDDKEIFNSILKEGSLFISYYGGVGYTLLSDDTRMIEVKVGPYEVKSDNEDRVLL